MYEQKKEGGGSLKTSKNGEQPDSGFRPVLNRDIMLDLLADHSRGLSREDEKVVVKSPAYRGSVGNIRSRAFDYGQKIFYLTKLFLSGNISAETDLFIAYCALLSETYRESFDVAVLMPELPNEVRRFLNDSHECFEPVAVPQTDFSMVLYDHSSDKQFLELRLQTALDAIAHLIVRALVHKIRRCQKTMVIRTNTHIRDLARLAMDTISEHHMVLLFGATNPSAKKTVEHLIASFMEEANNMHIDRYMGDGKMFDDERFVNDGKTKDLISKMTGGQIQAFRLP